jgi:NADPH-dependent 2,4-dienoyl-CoA reductase/sulfur reductase-like enzyme/nitrite reductase/ring-hydroxylating ferredoxin subunit
MEENERLVGHVGDLQDGEMREIDIGERSVLLVRSNGEYHVIGSHCTHYGAPLAKGVVCGNHVVCPWHQTYFDIVTGKVEEPPALNAIQKYETRIEGDQILVRIPVDVADGRVMPMVRYNRDIDKRTFIIIGAGAAGSIAAETLRQDGYQGRIVMITREKRIPYDRPHLSKGYFRERANPQPPNLRSPRFYMDHDIEILKERRVTRLDATFKLIEFDGFPSLNFDKVLVATGCEPKTINVPGAELQNIFTLRSFDDAYNLAKAVDRSAHIVIVGGGFIGTEVAASLAERGLVVTVVARERTLFEKKFGYEIGELFRGMHEARGVRFEFEDEVEQFRGDKSVEQVILRSGKKLDADVVLLAIGVRPVTNFIPDAFKNADGSIRVDSHMSFAVNCYAAGDNVSFVCPRTGETARIEHWRTAQQQGRCAAHNMAGVETEYTAVPFFWTHQLGVSLQCVGRTESYDEIIYHGSLSERNFVAYYAKNNEIRAVTGMNRHATMGAVAELMRENRMPTVDQLRAEPVDLVEQLKPVIAGQ